MAIIRNWQEPLEEALRSVLLKEHPSLSELNQIQKTLYMMDQGTEGTTRLASTLESEYQRLEKRYQEAIQKIESADTSGDVEIAVNDLQNLGEYKDSAEKIAEGNRRIQELLRQEEEKRAQEQARVRKRKLITWLSIAAAIAAVIVFFVVKEQNRQSRIKVLTAQVQTMIEAQQEEVITVPMSELASLGVVPEDLHPLSEAALESLALREGAKDAYALLSILNEGGSDFADSAAFDGWLLEQTAAKELPLEKRWSFTTVYLDMQIAEAEAKGKEFIYDEFARSSDEDLAHFPLIYDKCLLSAASKDEAWEADRWNSWIGEIRPYMAFFPANPETALQLSYRMNDEGVNLRDALPNGIRITLPIAPSVSACNTWYLSDESADSPLYPNSDKLLPISIVETMYSDMYNKTHSSESSLESDIQSLQATDDHYSVYLLSGDLLSIQEDLRAQTFSECTAYVAMQQSYLLAGSTYTERIYTNNRNNSYSSLYGYDFNPSGYKSDYRGNYAALDAVVIYDASDSDRFTVYNVSIQMPTISEDGWYDTHKGKDDYILENVVGVHDADALSQSYSDCIDNLWIVQLLGSIQTTDETDTMVSENGTDLAEPTENMEG